jgi:hypothetical protein
MYHYFVDLRLLWKYCRVSRLPQTVLETPGLANTVLPQVRRNLALSRLRQKRLTLYVEILSWFVD